MVVKKTYHEDKNVPPRARDLLGVISNQDSLFLFKLIADPNFNETTDARDISEFIGNNKYSRSLFDFIKLGLVNRRNGAKYSVTKFGKDVYQALSLIEDALEIKNKLEFIDSLDSYEIPYTERNRIIERLIENKKIQCIIIKNAADSMCQ